MKQTKEEKEIESMYETGRISTQRVYETIFELELEGWCLDDEKWPSIRTLGVFMEWFTVEFHSMVIDLCGDPLVDDYA